MKRAILRWLTRKNQRSPYAIQRVAELREPGADIVADRNGHLFIIEAKGDPDPRTVQRKNRSANRTVKLQLAIAEIVSRMKREQAAKYGIGLPESYRELAVRSIPWVAAKRLSLRLLFVDEDGKVSVVTARSLRARQRK